MSCAAFVAAGLLAATLPRPATAKDAPSYPEGTSNQTLGDHTFDLIVPAAADAKPPFSLLVVLQDAGTAVAQFAPLAKDGFVVLLPNQKFRGGKWATSEGKDILDDADAVAAAFSVPDERTHLLAVHDYRGFASFVAFDKRRSFASVSYSSSDDWSQIGGGKSPPADARKHLGMLLLGEGADAKHGDPEKIAANYAEKVRTIEYRRDSDAFKPYFRYWLGVMEGRFRPGHDLSFDWIEDAPPAPAAKSGAKDPPPAAAAQNALDSARAIAKSGGRAAFVYFWSADDAAKPEAKALQNEAFLDSEVRSAAKSLLAVKLDRAKYADAFAAFGMKATPAVAVVDPAFSVLDRFEGAVAAKALAKSFAKAAAASKPK
jgi:hypothetical protein